jgi:hypothetical protein
MAGKINNLELKKEIFNSAEVKRLVKNIIDKEVRKEKEVFLKEFNTHPVTQEIEGGENASNISNTLGGYGNLFSFIGFERGSTPTTIVKKLINTIKVINITTSSTGEISAEISIPSKDELADATPLPWENGRSWLFDVEKTISGLGAFLYKKSISSRSGTGIQSQYDFSSKSFRRISYFNAMYNKFLKKLSK